MTHHDEHAAASSVSSITVRAAAGQLRIITVWQALGPYAAHAKRTRVHHSRKHDFDEMTVMFDSVSPPELADIARRLNGQPWVVAATLQLASASSPAVRSETGRSA